jgi:hypothetical protein
LTIEQVNEGYLGLLELLPQLDPNSPDARQTKRRGVAQVAEAQGFFVAKRG